MTYIPKSKINILDTELQMKIDHHKDSNTEQMFIELQEIENSKIEDKMLGSTKAADDVYAITPARL